MRRHFWSSLVIVASLALGTGANVAVYSAVDGLLFRAPAGIRDAGALTEIYTSEINGATYGPSSWSDLADMTRAGSGRFEPAAIDELGEQMLRDGATTRLSWVDGVSPNFWVVLGAEPLFGAWPRAEAVSDAVISTRLWRELGGSPSVLGRIVALDGRAIRIVAIAPDRFRGVRLARAVDIWIPAAPNAAQSRGDRHLHVMARLVGTTLNGAQPVLDSLSGRLAADHPETNLGTLRAPEEIRRLTIRPYSRLEPALQTRAVVMSGVVIGAALLLLLSACVNAGSLLLSRGLARRPELAIRTALGAERGRLVRAFLWEGTRLALAGAAGGLLVAYWTKDFLPSLFAPEHAALFDARIEPVTMATAIGAAIAAGMLFGTAPALISTRALEREALSADESRVGERPQGTSLRQWLVGSQLALSAVFLIAAVLLGHMMQGTLGPDRSSLDDRLYVVTIDRAGASYRTDAEAAVGHLAGVRLIGWVTTLPLERTVHARFHLRRGAQEQTLEFAVNYASPAYFRAMRQPLLDASGHLPNEDEPDNAILVNEALAQRYFAGRAVGQELIDPAGMAVRITGVVRTRAYRAFEGDPEPTIYYPMRRSSARVFHAVVALAFDAAATPRMLTSAFQAVGPSAHVDVTTMNAVLGSALAPDRVLVRLVTACGLLALLLAAIGVYGVMTDLVHRRTHEIGLRIALGASPARVVGICAGGSIVPAAIGAVAGLFLAALLSRGARALVFGIPEIGPALAAETALVIALAVAAALLIPVVRAVRISPLVALRAR